MEMYKIGLLTCIAAIMTAVQSHEISLQMSTDDPRAIGDDVTFHCRVDDFPPGAAVMWWKRQGPEEVKVGTNGELEVDVARYILEVQQANTAVLFYLNIRGITPEDNGEFGCSLTSDAESKVYRNLVVSDPVQTIHLYQLAGVNSTEVIHEFQDGESFYFHDEQHYFFQCVASGSNPPPEMKITIGYKDGVESLNDKFDRTDKLISDSSSGEVAFRKTNYEGTLTSNTAVIVDWKANSQEVKCSASVANMDTPKSVNIKPILKIAPIIECVDSVKIPIWTADVSFECNVYADPPLQEIVWYWGNEYRATSLRPGEVDGAFRFDLLDGDKPDMKVARLRMDRIFIQMFQKYNLGAKNEKGLSTHSLSLDRDTANEDKVQSGAAFNSLPITLLMMMSAVATYMQ